MVTSTENSAQITRLSQLENSAIGTWPIYKNSIIPDWFEKWRDMNSDTGVNCVVPQNYDVCPLLMMHKTCSINYGHLADLQKALPTTDLNKKKNFHLIKYLLATFIFFPFFSICTCIFRNRLWLTLSGIRLSLLLFHKMTLLNRYISGFRLCIYGFFITTYHYSIATSQSLLEWQWSVHSIAAPSLPLHCHSGVALRC